MERGQYDYQISMSPETISALYKVQDLMKEARRVLDERMYGGNALEPGEKAVCQRVYSAVCKVLDHL